MAAVFPYFSAKRQRRGNFIKCAEVRTKKVCRKCGMLQKVAQKKSGDVFRKIRENANKKRNYVTRYMREGNAQKCKQKRNFLTRYAQERKTLIFRAKLN